ncbi:hypothetical protein CAL14_07730 [Bordetella genomosp. 9]|nr:hypothetical protein CAL14_07730 [Bordetella genomosp. 9]
MRRNHAQGWLTDRESGMAGILPTPSQEHWPMTRTQSRSLVASSQRHPDSDRAGVRSTTERADPQSTMHARAFASVALAAAGALIASGATAASASSAVDSYDKLVSALTGGRLLATVLDLSQCDRGTSIKPPPHILGGMMISRFLIPDGKYVAFADVHATLDTESRPIVEYIRYRAMRDGSVIVRFDSRPEGSDEVTMRGEYRCGIDKGIRFLDTGEPPEPSLVPLAQTTEKMTIEGSGSRADDSANGGNLDQQRELRDGKGMR